MYHDCQSYRVVRIRNTLLFICKHSRYSAHEQLNRERNDPDRCLDGPAAGAYISLQFVESKQSDLQ
jgi:hypothetical protein